jgi:HK97 family phage portal protein
MWQYDGMARTVICLALFGEAFWYTLTRDYLGFPSAIEILHPAFIEIKKDAAGQLIYLYGSGVQKVKLDPSSLTHIPFLAMPGAERGLNSIEYGGVTFALAIAALEFGQRWFAQGQSPSFVLSTEQKLGQEEVARIAEKFFTQKGGLQNAHLPLVVDAGMKVENLEKGPDTGQFIGTLEYARMCIAAWFGLPSHLVGGSGDKGNVWGKTVQEQGFQMVDYTLSGYVVRLEEAFSSLLPRGTFAAMDESAILRANAADLAAEITALRTTGVETPNEIRVNKLKLPPLPDGDDLVAPLASNVAPGATGDAIEGADKEDDAGSNSGGNQ